MDLYFLSSPTRAKSLRGLASAYGTLRSVPFFIVAAVILVGLWILFPSPSLLFLLQSPSFCSTRPVTVLLSFAEYPYFNQSMNLFPPQSNNPFRSPTGEFAVTIGELSPKENRKKRCSRSPFPSKSNNMMVRFDWIKKKERPATQLPGTHVNGWQPFHSKIVFHTLQKVGTLIQKNVASISDERKWR
jgi:hypothetical protein